MSRRLAALAALAVVLGCAGCDADSLKQSATDAASSAGDKVSAQTADSLTAQLDAKKAELAAAAKRQAAELAAAADKALQDQLASATASAKAQLTAAVASAVPSPLVVTPSPVPAAPVESTHTVTGTYTSPEVVDASGGAACATLTNVVGQEVAISTGTDTVKGALTACTWSAPGPLGSSPVFSFTVQQVPEATSYDVSIGDRSWKVSGTALAAAGWTLSLT